MQCLAGCSSSMRDCNIGGSLRIAHPESVLRLTSGTSGSKRQDTVVQIMWCGNAAVTAEQRSS
jgi:hypothetical protein